MLVRTVLYCGLHSCIVTQMLTMWASREQYVSKEQHELKTVGIYDMIMQGIGIGCIISSPPSFDPAAVVSDVPAGCHM